MQETAKIFQQHGVAIQTLPYATVEREITYSEITDFLDLLVFDLLKFRPNIVDQSVKIPIQVSQIKAVYYAVFLYHCRQAGILTGSSYTLPDAAGFPVPIPMLAFMQHIGNYAEGELIGKLTYRTQSAIPSTGNDIIIGNSVPVETDLSLSYLPNNISNYLTSATYNEVYLQPSTVNVIDMLTSWNSSSAAIADVVKAIGYPCLPMWSKPPLVPDGSIFVYPTFNLVNSPGGETIDPFWTSPFLLWDMELANLYYRLPSASSVYGLPYDARPGLMLASFPVSGNYISAGAGSYYNTFRGLKSAFIFVMRNNVDYVPGCGLFKLRMYHGDKLRTFVPQVLRVDLSRWHEFVARTFEHITQLGYTYDQTEAFAYLALMDIVLLRKWMLNTFGYYMNASFNLQLLIPPAEVDMVVPPISVTSILNEFGPYVRHGKLHVPGAPFTSISWYTNRNVLGPNSAALGGRSELYNYGMRYTGANLTTLTWNYSGVTTIANAAWVTGYGGLAGNMQTPWIVIGQMNTVVSDMFTGSGSALQPSYSRGDYVYPWSKGPRGGAAMTVYNLAGNVVNSATSRFAADVFIVYTPTTQIFTMSVITGPDITLAVLSQFVSAGIDSPEAVKQLLDLDYKGPTPVIPGYLTKVYSPGGTFLTTLSQSIAKTHNGYDMAYGIVSANDTTDGCLWESVKGVAGVLTTALIPAFAAGAGVACGEIPGIGSITGPFCTSLVNKLGQYIKDTSLTSTNRSASKSYKKEKIDVSNVIRKVAVKNKTATAKGLTPPVDRSGAWDVKVPIVRYAQQKGVQRAYRPSRKALANPMMRRRLPAIPVVPALPPRGPKYLQALKHPKLRKQRRAYYEKNGLTVPRGSRKVTRNGYVSYTI